jgi:CRISPR-associated endonuclease Cas1
MPHFASMLAREILRQKIDSQHQTLAAHQDVLPGAHKALEQFKVWKAWLSLPKPPPWQYNLDRLRLIEGRLAHHYFSAWVGLALPFAKTDAPRLPSYWLFARERSSPLSPQKNGRRAVDPLNSILNYSYGCLASQCRQSLISAGLDISCGYLHSNQKGRDSLTWDLVELGRAQVDHLVLSLLARTTLHRADFARESNGQVMLHPQFVRVVLATCRLPQAEIDGHASWLADWLRNADQSTALSAPVARHDDGPAE